MAELSKASITQLEREIEKRRARIAQLQERRQGLSAQLEAVDGELEALAGGGATGAVEAKAAPQRKRRVAKAREVSESGGKPGRRPILTEAIRSILGESAEPMNAGDIADALKRRRFKTKSKNLQNLVREALSRIPDVERVSRGMYSLK